MNYLQMSYTVSMEIQEVVASNIMSIRGEMPRQKLASLAGVTYQHIYEIEEKIKYPSLKVLAKIADALNVELSLLLRERSKSEEPMARIEPMSKIIKKLAAIPDDIYEKVPMFGPNHDVWDSVRVIMKDAEKDIEKKKSGSKHA